MNTTQTSTATKFRVGLFTVLVLLLIGAVTVFVNDKPFWWRSCQLVHINVEDATGLKMKSPVRSLGLQIGYLKTVELTETYVRLGICITAPVDVLPVTRAYIRGEGFLGDKFVELKPVKYLGSKPVEDQNAERSSFLKRIRLIPEANAQEAVASPAQTPVATPTPTPTPPAPQKRGSRDIPVSEGSQDVQRVVERVDGLVKEITSLTTNLKDAINPKELRSTMQQLNRTLENASKTLSPEGGINTTAQRALSKLEDAIEQLRDMMTRINKGEGSVGKLLNDPTYADEIKEAIRNVNRLLSKVGGVRFIVDVGAEQIPAYDGGRGWFKLGIWPQPNRYYLLGITIDPRGKRTVTSTTTVAGGVTTTTQTTQVEQSAVLLTGMLGKVFYDRFDLSVGVLHSDGTVEAKIHIGPAEHIQLATLINDVYSRGLGTGIEDRITLVIKPWKDVTPLQSIYLRGGLESLRQINGKTGYFFGAGLTFDDDDIKLLFALR